MSVKKYHWIETLEENPKDVYLDSTSVLLKLVDNVLQNPSNLKFRSIRLANDIVCKKLMPAIGAMECLFEMGFEEEEDRLTLPLGTSLEHLKRIRNEISSRRNSYLTSAAQAKTTNETAAPAATTSQQTSGNSSKTKDEESNSRDKNSEANQRQTGAISKNKNVASAQTVNVSTCGTGPSSSQNTVPRPQFLQSIHNNCHSVLRYENKELQKIALSLIPVGELELAAEQKMHAIRKSMKQLQSKEQGIEVKELLLMELLNWFKNSFFTWVDAPLCDYCRGETKFIGMSSNPKELVDTNRVEVYTCKQCNHNTLFPRYHDPAMLLKTRRGRCGEWASCFTLLCRAMGWDVRYVVDELDHVWTEVYSMTQGRWLHCDACENVCDQPLLYEKGWGKKLTYVIAYSWEDVQDVTWRYSCDHRAVLARRTLCSEEELLATISQLRQEQQKVLSEKRQAYLTRRMLAELVEFLLPQQSSQDEYQGRTSGSLAWRMARGETRVVEPFVPYVWEPNEEEKVSREMQILYAAAQDKYVRGSTKEEAIHWESRVFKAESVFRKEEKDWKIAYLARAESSQVGTVVWKVDCSRSGLVVDSVSVLCSCTVFETGRVRLTLCSEDNCVLVPSGDSMFETNALRGSTSFTLTAHLSGGKGTVAWQHAQLFRQPVDNKQDFPLNIIVKFQKP